MRFSNCSIEAQARCIRASLAGGGGLASYLRPLRNPRISVTRSASAEVTVPRIAQSWNDVGLLIQTGINRGRVYADVWVLAANLVQPFRAAYTTHKADPCRAGL